MTENIYYSASAAILNRFGDELIKDNQTAFFELIKNSFDADATLVSVKFRNTKNIDGEIIIEDNGGGMSLEDIKTKWARAAGENKIRNPFTPKFNRKQLGAKGIGRFSISKLGSFVKVITKPANSSKQYVFKVNFNDFTDDKDFDKMPLDLREGQPRRGFSNGTILEIKNLRNKWTKRDIQKAKNQLSHLIDPESKDQNFQISFESKDYPELSGIIENPLTGQESHLIIFEIDAKGKYKCESTIGEKKNIERKTLSPLSCGPIKGKIKYYKDGVKTRDRRIDDTTDESHLGLKVYRDSCRVRPYGEESDDWLEIKKKRARAGGKYYILSNSIAGSVYISSLSNPKLKDATNREAGIIETIEFYEFQEFVQQQIDKLNKILEQETKSDSTKQKRQTIQKILNTVVHCLNQEESDTYENYVATIDRGKKGDFGESYSSKFTKVKDIKLPSKEEWCCLDCDEIWRVIKDQIPEFCLDKAVNRKGALRDAEGCGSKNIEKSKHKPKQKETDLSSIISGEYALISGRQLKVRVDYDMGKLDDEYNISEREIIINGNHIGFTVSALLDNMSGKKYEFGDDVFVPALTIHITKCACLAWAELHYKKDKDWLEFKTRYDNLQEKIFNEVKKNLKPLKI